MKAAASRLALGGFAVWSAPAAAPLVPVLATSLGIQTRLRHPSGIALTFDDGPHPEGTLAVLEILATADARATFFLVGEQVERYGSVVNAIVGAGHEVACHGYKHTLQLRRTPTAVRDDFRRAVQVLGDATGREPRYFRPPYGVFSAAGLAIVKRSDCVPLLWSQWGKDWSPHTTAEAIAHTAGAHLRAGDVVLLHDSDAYSSPASWRKTVSALPAIIGAAEGSGEPLISVSQST